MKPFIMFKLLGLFVKACFMKSFTVSVWSIKFIHFSVHCAVWSLFLLH